MKKFKAIVFLILFAAFVYPEEGFLSIVEDENWRTVTNIDTTIISGSVLDMSDFNDNHKVGDYGRVIITTNGGMAFEKRPEKRILFWGSANSLLKFQASEFKTKAKIKNFVELTKRQGYNIIRTTMLDAYLMQNSKTDLVFNETNFDNLCYFVSCMKDNGIYLFLDAMTSWSGYKGEGGSSKAITKKYKLKGDLFYSEEARSNWYNGVKMLLTRENPYTKTKLIDDPVLAVLLYFNEQGCYLIQEGTPEKYADFWKDFLKEKYVSIDKLNASWNTNISSFDDIVNFKFKETLDRNIKANDMNLFLFGMDQKMLDWFDKSIKKIGYKGITTHWDNYKQIKYSVARNSVPLISMHGYHTHPGGDINSKQTVRQTSSLEDEMEYFTGIAATRIVGRPFWVPEYNHVFYNKYKYEEGLAFSSYSALQDFDALFSHASPVYSSIDKPLNNFHLGNNPIGRANQVVTGFVFMRRDVAPAKTVIKINFNDDLIFNNNNLIRAVNTEQATLSLLTKFSFNYAGKIFSPYQKEIKADYEINPIETSVVYWWLMTDEIGKDTNINYMSNLLPDLKKNNIITTDNLSDPKNGIFQSSTKEIILNKNEKNINVITKKLEGTAYTGSTIVNLNCVTKIKSSIASGITVIAKDNIELSKSKRILIVYTTDAVNSGMKFSEDRVNLIEKGELPVLMQCGKLSLNIKNANAGKMKLWAVALNGKRTEEIKFIASKDSAEISIDTYKIKNGPTPFFEMAVE